MDQQSEAIKQTTKKPKSTTVIDKIIYAIRNQPPSSSNGGVSRITITKYLKSELDYDNGTALKAALKRGVSSGVLTQIGQSFRVTNDPVLPGNNNTAESTVQIDDMKLGNDSADAASVGDTIVVAYVGKLASDGSTFDSSKNFEFTLGAGEVIQGWDRGILGMKIGGQRQLHIPSKLGYGKRGSLPDIPPNADLLFTVTLKKIQRETQN